MAPTATRKLANIRAMLKAKYTFTLFSGFSRISLM